MTSHHESSVADRDSAEIAKRSYRAYVDKDRSEIERLLADWRDDHPGVVVTTLRSAPVLGVGAERLPARLLLGRPPLRIRGAAPPVQAVHVDDLVAALALLVFEDHPGTFNVASDGWLDPATPAPSQEPHRPIP